MSDRSSQIMLLTIIIITMLFASAASQAQQTNHKTQGGGPLSPKTGGDGPVYGNESYPNVWYGDGAEGSFTSGYGDSHFGINAGADTTAGYYNSFFGNFAGRRNTTGFNNSYYGAFAGRGPILGESTGSDNSFFGASAGFNNTTGNSNSFFGSLAGYANTTGYENSIFGMIAGRSNTTGYENSFFGVLAGFSNTTGDSNSFIGSGAGYANTHGQANSFVGAHAGYYNTGSANSFLGFEAGNKNTYGGGNSYFGSSAGFSNTSGGGNSFLGYAAGLYNTTGGSNSFFGNHAGLSNTSENNNTLIGASSDTAAGTTNATAVGYRAKVTQSNSLVLGSIAGVNSAEADTKVGIGTIAPVSTLNVRSTTNDSPRGVTNEQYNNGMDGVQFRARKARGTYTSLAAVQSGDVLGNYVFDGHDGTAFGTGVQIRPVTEESWTSTAHGAYLALWTTPPGSTTNLERLRITGAGNVGIGLTHPVEKLHVNGSIRATGSIYSQPSPGMEIPDYVFESDYNLMPIPELEKYVAREKHLPNVPKAKEIRENGLNHTEFQIKLLEKIEELMLYAVQQARTNQDQQSALELKEARIAVLEEKNDKLEARLAILERMVEGQTKRE